VTYALATFHDPSLQSLGATYPGSTTIHINDAVTPQGFRAYFQGEIPSPSSAQKKAVLGRLASLGWGWERIQKLLSSKLSVRRFLVLHEISHLNHNDPETYHQKSPEEKIEIETRASLEALEQILTEKAR